MRVERVARRARDGSPALSGVLGRLARLVACSPRPVWLVAAVLAGLALLGMRRIEVDADFMNYFGQRSKVRQAPSPSTDGLLRLLRKSCSTVRRRSSAGSKVICSW